MAISEQAATRLLDFSREYYAAHPDIEAFFYGHLHIARMNTVEGLPPVVFRCDWIKLYSYAVIDAKGQISLQYYKD